MPTIRIRGQDYNIRLTKDSFIRRATQYSNQIITQLRSVGLSTDDIEVSEEKAPMKKAPANVSWWIQDQHCNFSYNKMSRYVDNLLVVSAVIKQKINELVNETITVDEFIGMFKEDKDFDKKRLEAREFFGLDKDHIDLEIINEKYKKLAKTLHPDTPTGDVEKFKELNVYHKILKRELE